jgi:hypothetical protein
MTNDKTLRGLDGLSDYLPDNPRKVYASVTLVY